MNFPLANIYVIGLGAIGLKYAARLHDAAPGQIHILADAARIAAFERQPPTVNGQPYALHYVTAAADSPVADLILVAVKASQLPAAITAMRPVVGPQTAILSLLNGIQSEDTLAAAFGAEHVLYANVYMDAVRQGHAVTYQDIGRIVFGERDNTVRSPRVNAIAALFARAGIPCEVPTDMLRAHWAKFMVNVGVNQASAVLGAPYGTFQRNAEARALMIAAAQEVVTLSQYAGIHLDQSDIERFLRIMDALSPHAKTSMLQDMQAGRPTEVDIFGGAVLALGQRYGVPTPVNQTLVQIIRAMESQRSSERAA